MRTPRDEPASPDDPGAEWQPRSHPWLIAVSVMLATFMEILDSTIVTVSLPHIAGSLSATPAEGTWVLTSYLVSNAIILPTAAWFGGLFGRKRFLIGCIGLFTLASAICGAAPTLGLLIGARVLQGVGGGALQPIAQAILLESFPPHRRGVAMAAFAMGVIVAPILGPTLGGWITDSYSWRWIFYVNLPIGLLAVTMVQTVVEDPPYIARQRRSRIDYLGFGLMTLWLSTLQFTLDKGQEVDWFAAQSLRWLAVVSTVALVGFVVRELRTAHPIVDLRILADRNFGVGTLLMTLMAVVLYGTTAMLPLFLQTLLGYTALDSGWAVSPRGLGAFLAGLTVGRLVGIVDTRILISTGFGLMVVSGWVFSHLNLQIAMSSVMWATVVNGFATPLVFIPLTTTAMGTLRNERISNATGIFNLMRNIGGGIGIAAMTTFLARGTQAHQAALVSHLTPYDPAYRHWLEVTQSGLQSKVGSTDAAAKALGLLYGELGRQATLLSYMDNFRLISVMGLACLPLVLLFRKPRPRPAIVVE